jgi:malonate-semialdehyde dehydrogenase (acetylating)/methylmalonate-semialdehyde dehydrogenase
MYAARTARILSSRLAQSARLSLRVTQGTVATAIWPTTHKKIQVVAPTTNYIDKTFTESKTQQWIDLQDPATNNLVTRVLESTDEELNEAVASAQKAFQS